MHTASNNPDYEKHNTAEDPNEKRKAIRLAGKLALVGALLLGPIDLAVGDAAAARLYGTLRHDVNLTDNGVMNHIIVDGIELSAITAAEAALAIGATRNKDMLNMSTGYNEYLDERRKKMGKFRSGVSKVLNSPLKLFEYVGSGLKAAGNAMTSRDSSFAKKTGGLLVEAGINNTWGNVNTAVQQTMEGNPPSIGRNVRYAAEIGAVFVAGAEIVNAINYIPFVNEGLSFIGRHIQELTSADLNNLSGGDIVLGGLTAVLIMHGWKIANFHEHKAGE